MKTKIDKFKGLVKVFRLLDNWGVYLKDYLGLYNQKFITYKLRNGRAIIVGVKGRVGRRTFNEIFVYEEYCPDENFKIKKGYTVIDIGANIGVFSIYCKDAKKVYAFEPVSENVKILKENLSKNSIKNVEVIDKAVSSKNSSRKIYITEDMGSHTLIKNFQNPKEMRMVRTTSLENFIKKNKINKVDFLKIDCEGSEFEILYSLSKEIFKRIDRISMEVHKFGKEADYNKLADFLRKMGFKIKKTKEGIYSMIYAIKPSLLGRENA